jgi:hypothetical protein
MKPKLTMKTPKAQENSCFANYHLTVAEYGLWEHGRAISFKRGRLLFDGRKMAARFSGTGKDTFYRLAAQLVKKGWFEVVDDNTTKSGKRKRDRSGHYLATVYKVLSHEQWVSRYGSSTCPQNQTGDDDQSSDRDTSSPLDETRPVPESRHKSDGDLSDGSPSDANLIEGPVWKSRQVEEGSTLNVHGSARHPVAAPVAKSRQAVPSTKPQPHEVLAARRIVDGVDKPASLYAPWQPVEWAKQILAAQDGRNAD